MAALGVLIAFLLFCWLTAVLADRIKHPVTKVVFILVMFGVFIVALTSTISK